MPLDQDRIETINLEIKLVAERIKLHLIALNYIDKLPPDLAPPPKKPVSVPPRIKKETSILLEKVEEYLKA